MKSTRILAMTLITVAISAGGASAGMAGGANSNGPSTGGSISGSGSTTIHENSGIVTTPPADTSSSGLPENTAPRSQPGIVPDNGNTAPRELPSPSAAGGSAGGSLTAPAPANDASTNGAGTDVLNGGAPTVPNDSSSVLNGTGGSRSSGENSKVKMR